MAELSHADIFSLRFLFQHTIQNTMLKKLFMGATVAATLVLGACKDQTSTLPANQASATSVSIDAIQAEAKGFSVGVPMSARTVYVFFDPQCPHCTVLWKSAKPLKNQIRFLWIPVGIINASSTSQGATILAMPDPEAAMDAHEVSMTAKTGGISATRDIEPSKAAVAQNTQLMTRFGFASIPTIVTTNVQTGALITHEGSMPTAALASFLGLTVRP
ncbi:MAG: thiol:disulfide interchange protein DsbG [Polaromonas sp.]|jgi:thiol:disulfide interchange protein DsbG